MEELIKRLKEKRTELEYAQEAVNSSFELAKKTEEYKFYEISKQEALLVQYELEEIDDLLRNEAIKSYLETGNKKPVDGVSIAINKELVYSPDVALDWAIDHHASDLITLKKVQFEKHARAVLGTMPLRFVDVEEKPSVKIAKEL